MTAVRRAFLLAWLAASALLAPVVLAPWVLPEEVVLEAAARCRSQHRNGQPCPLCGMTRGFLSIARGDWSQAERWNPASVPVYLAVAANELAAAAAAIGRRR